MRVLSILAISAILSLVGLVSWSSSALAQNTGTGDFQFNELDFDRQGAASPGQPGVDNLIDLFTDQPNAPAPTTQAPSANSIQNLPGEPSPVSVPAAQGEAKIEVSGPKPAPAAPTAAPVSAPEPPKRILEGNQWYWATQAWRLAPSGGSCSSYASHRLVLNVRCISNIAP